MVVHFGCRENLLATTIRETVDVVEQCVGLKELHLDRFCCAVQIFPAMNGTVEDLGAMPLGYAMLIIAFLLFRHSNSIHTKPCLLQCQPGNVAFSSCQVHWQRLRAHQRGFGLIEFDDVSISCWIASEQRPCRCHHLWADILIQPTLKSV